MKQYDYKANNGQDGIIIMSFTDLCFSPYTVNYKLSFSAWPKYKKSEINRNCGADLVFIT